MEPLHCGAPFNYYQATKPCVAGLLLPDVCNDTNSRKIARFMQDYPRYLSLQTKLAVPDTSLGTYLIEIESMDDL